MSKLSLKNCVTDEERNEVRDQMIEEIYNKLCGIESDIWHIKKVIDKIENKVIYLSANKKLRKFLNEDGTIDIFKDKVYRHSHELLELFKFKEAVL